MPFKVKEKESAMEGFKFKVREHRDERKPEDMPLVIGEVQLTRECAKNYGLEEWFKSACESPDTAERFVWGEELIGIPMGPCRHCDGDAVLVKVTVDHFFGESWVFECDKCKKGYTLHGVTFEGMTGGEMEPDDDVVVEEAFTMKSEV